MPVTPFYAALFGFVLVALSIRTLRLRRNLKIAIGHGNVPLLERAMRTHANFCEYVPLSLLLIYMFEILVGSSLWIHVFGAALLLGRLSHAYGVSQVSEDYRFRVTGMALTFTVMIISSTWILIRYAGWLSA